MENTPAGPEQICASNPTGLSAELMAPVKENSTAIQRVLPHAWITGERIAETQRVWGEFLSRPIPEDEAIEMLVNVRRLAEVLAKAAYRTEGW